MGAAMIGPAATESREHDVDLGARRDRERRVLGAGLLASVALHLLILLLSPAAEVILAAAAGPNRNDNRAAAGVAEVVALASAPPEVAIAIPIPEPVIVPLEPEVFIPEPIPEPIEVPLPPVEEVGVGDTTGDDAQDVGTAGLPDATGAGAGGDRAEGTDRRPLLRGAIIPPPRPSGVNVREITVRIFVDTAGRVVADSTRLEPPTSNRSFNERLLRDAASWTFAPARENGTPVADWYAYTIEY